MTLEHLDKQTMDGTQLNLDALYRICPSCFTETAGEKGQLKHVVNFEKLRALLGDNVEEDAPEVYDFTQSSDEYDEHNKNEQGERYFSKGDMDEDGAFLYMSSHPSDGLAGASSAWNICKDRNYF